MSATDRCCGVLLLSAGLVFATGCQGAGLRLLSLIGIQKQPVMVDFPIERDSQPKDIAEWINPVRPYEPLLAAMQESVGRPVGYGMCLPIQLAPNLDLGISHLAVVSPAQYGQFLAGGNTEVLAVALDERQRPARSALLVVARDAKTESVADLRGKHVAFGPRDDARTHHAALRLLAEHGLAKTDLALEVLPVPGSLKHMPHMRAVAQSVINGSSDAGFVDEAAWEAFPESDDREGEPARDKLRVIARTTPVPNRLIVRSPKLDAATAGRVRDFLLGVGEQDGAALEPLRISGYAQPSAELVTLCRELVTQQPAPPADKSGEGQPPGAAMSHEP